MRRVLLLAAVCLTTPSQAQDAVIRYPHSTRVDQVDEQFGVKVADPYRWLENDVRTDPKVAAWVAAQNQVTNAYLAALPGRDVFKNRMRTLFDYERFGLPVKKGGRYFYSRNAGLQNQSVLYVRESLSGEGRVLIDPNGWSKDGATALAEWRPSEDGRTLAYTVQDGGSDWRTVKFLDVRSGRQLSDSIEWVKFSPIVWAKDGSGLFYSRFAEPQAGAKFQASNLNQQVYFHRIGTPQSADRLIYATPERPKLSHRAVVSDDGRWLVINSSDAGEESEIVLVDLTRPRTLPRVLVPGFESSWSFVGNIGSRLFFRTNAGAPRYRLVALDMGRTRPKPIEVIGEDKGTLDDVELTGGTLVASYLMDAQTNVRRYAPDGRLLGEVTLPGIGTASGFAGDSNDPETFFAFTSFTRPATIYRLDVRSGEASVWAAPKVAFDPDAYQVEQEFFTSKDGTRVPMFIVHKKGLDHKGSAPTILYGYGGFNVSLTPGFSATRLAWLEQGGILAVANLRGGGEYGKAWHDAGKLANKQNVFDDAIAAAEFLIDHGATTPGKLVIQGGSNGGLLVGAVINQRPDLFAAALPAVGVMDMTRFDRFTAGRYWVNDYGVPAKEADFRTLYAYSPYHNLAAGKTYPAILATTADTDDRVVPGHTFKYVAAVQAAELGPKPRLVRIETRAGHGSGKPTDKVIEEAADLWAFAAKWTGMTVKSVR
jgi:prolyl oligopeptidase